jgi:hypothetical protein
MRQQTAATIRQRVVEAHKRQFTDSSRELTFECAAEVADASVRTVLSAFGRQRPSAMEAIATLRPSESPVGVDSADYPGEVLKIPVDDYERTGLFPTSGHGGVPDRLSTSTELVVILEDDAPRTNAVRANEAHVRSLA